jgi:hypothetical protein
MSSDLIHIESGLIGWLSISFFITTIVPYFFLLNIDKEIQYKNINIMFFILIFFSCIIILFSLIPFYYRHKIAMKKITDNDIKQRENIVFIAQLIFCVFYFIFNVCILIFLIKKFF